LSRQEWIKFGTFRVDYGNVCCQNCTEWSLT
jgi:hypothetical protein